MYFCLTTYNIIHTKTPNLIEVPVVHFYLTTYKKILSLMAPFQSAYTKKAMNQLEGMVGTLRVNAARLVSPEDYWIFTGDDFDLKISAPFSPSYLVIANDPEKEQIVDALNALVLNRLVTRVNSRGNIPVSIIANELPTLYFHKIDRLIGTTRSNKMAVTLAFRNCHSWRRTMARTVCRR